MRFRNTYVVLGLLASVITFLPLYGCDEVPFLGNRLVPGRLVPGRLVPGRLVPGRVVGNASNGFALVNADVVLMTFDGSVQLATTTDAEGNFAFEEVGDLPFPILIYVQDPGDSLLTTVVTTAPEEDGEQRANINPMTQVVTQEALGEDVVVALNRLARQSDRLTDGNIQRLIAADLASLTENEWRTTGETATQLAIGETVIFSSYYDQPYTARTETSPTAGNYQDTLMDAVATLSPLLSSQEILSRAIDPNDPSFAGDLMGTLDFQSTVSGELLARGRTGTEALEVLSNAGLSNNSTPVSNITSYVSSFEGISLSAGLSGVDGVDQTEALLTAFARLVADSVEASVVENAESLQTLLNNTVDTTSGALIAVAEQNQDLAPEGRLKILLNALGGEISTVLIDNAVDLTGVLTDASTLGNQLTNFSQTLAAPLATSLQDTSTARVAQTVGTASFDADRQQILMESVAREVSKGLTPFFTEFAQGVPEAAQNTANNIATPLTVSLNSMLEDPQTQSYSGNLVENFVEQVADATAQQIRSSGLDLAAPTLPTALVNTANNMVSLALSTAASAVSATSGAGSNDAQASVATASVEQTLNAVATLDLSGELPPEAETVVANVSQVITPALINSVTGTSNRQGDTLEVLVKNAAAAVTQELEAQGTVLTQPIENVPAATQTAVKAASESGIVLEQTFQQIETAGVDLGAVTNSFQEAQLDAEAIAEVATQVAEALTSESAGQETLQAEADSLALAAAETAKNVLQLGGDLEQVKQAVSVTTAAVQDVANSGGDAVAVKANAEAMSASVKTATESNTDVATLIQLTEDVAAAVTTAGDTAQVAGIVDTVQVNISLNTPIDLPDLVDASELDTATAKQEELNVAAQQAVEAADASLSQSQQDAATAFGSGQNLSDFNATLLVTTTSPPITVAAETEPAEAINTIPPTTRIVTTLPPTTGLVTTIPLSTVLVTTVPVITLPPIDQPEDATGGSDTTVTETTETTETTTETTETTEVTVTTTEVTTTTAISSGGGSGAPSVAAPSILSRSPTIGSTGISLATTIQVRFDSNMDSSTLTFGNFALATSDGTVVTGSVNYNGSNVTATLTPSTSLSLNTSYLASLSSNVQSLEGGALAATSWSFTTVAAPADPVVYYPFNGNANDAIERHNGLVNGATLTTDAASQANNAYLFDGSSGAIFVPGDTDELAITGDLTVSVWIRPDSFSGTHTVLDYGGNSELETGNDLYQLSFDSSGEMKFGWEFENGANLELGTTLNFTTSQWQHVAVVRKTGSQSDVAIFVNGQLRVSAANLPNPTGGTATDMLLSIGHDFGNNFFSGAMDELRIYNRALSSIEIDLLADFPLPDPGDSQMVSAGQTVKLDGTGSSDSRGTIQSYSWETNLQPVGSSISLSASNTSSSSFTPSVSGEYSIHLKVSDGTLASTNEVQVVAYQWTAEQGTAAWDARRSFGSVVFQNKFWLISGKTSSANQNDVWSSSDGVTWTSVTSSAFDSARQEICAAVFEDRMWVIGGEDNGGAALDAVWFSNDGISWRQALEDAPWAARHSHQCAVFQGRLWLMGGNSGSSPLNDIWYSEDGISWVQATSDAPWKAREGFALSVYQNQMWLMGGKDNSSNLLNDVWSSQDGLHWQQVAGSVGWGVREGLRSAVADGKLWITGGSGTASLHADAWYTTDGSTWTQATASGGWSVRQDHGFLSFREELWIFGGFDGSSYRQDVYRYGQGIESGLVAFYPFHGTAEDRGSSDPPLHGRIGNTGTPTLTTDFYNQSNSAYKFDGVDDVIEIADDDSIDFGTLEEFSISLWVKPDSTQVNTSNNTNSILEKWSGSGSYPYAIRYHNQTHSRPGEVEGVRFDNNAESSVISNVLINDDQFHHIVFSKQGRELLLFVDGILDSKNTDESSHSTENSTGITLGIRGDGNRPFSGTIDDIRIYNRGLTEAEVLNLFQAPLAVAGTDISVNTGATYTLSAAQSKSATGNTSLSYNWELLDQPNNSFSLLSADATPTPSFNADEIGTYEFHLTVADGVITSSDRISLESTAASSSNTMAFYPFSGNVNDASGNAHHGVPSNLSIASTNHLGQVNNGITLSNIGQWVSLPQATLNEMQSFTLASWVKLDGLSTNYNTILSGARANQVAALQWYYENSTNQWKLVVDNSAIASGNETTITDLAWHHAAVSKLGSTVNFYIDGHRFSSVTGVATTVTVDVGGVILGQEQKAVGSGFHIDEALRGKLDDFYIFESVLSDLEIQQLASARDIGLLAYYPFRANAKDISGHGRDGTVNSATLDNNRFQQAGQAYRVNVASASENISLPHTAMNDLNNFTLSAWVKLEALNSNENTILSGARSAQVDAFVWSYEATHNRFKFVLDGSTAATFSNSLMEDFQWHHVTLIRENTSTRMYIDGQFISESTTSDNALDIESGGLLVGQRQTTVGVGLDAQHSLGGRISDLRIYNRVLSPPEVQELASDLELGLTALFNFSGEAKDDSNRKHTVTVSGASLADDRFGRSSASYTFNGSSDSILAGTSTSLNSSTIGVAAWVNPTSGTGTHNPIVNKMNLGANQGYWLSFDSSNNQVRWIVGNGSSSGTVNDSNATTPGSQWTHVVASYDGVTSTVYINGALATSTAYASGLSVPSDQALRIGTDNSSNYFPGRIDDVRVYNRPLVPSEVALMASDFRSLVAYYPFNANADDNTSNTNNGTLQNSPTSRADRFGTANQAYDFTPTSSYIEVADDNTLDIGSNGLTITGWIYPLSISGEQSIASKWSNMSPATGQQSYRLYLVDGQLRFTLSSSGSNLTKVVSHTGINANVWTHVAAVYDGAEMRLYINGTEDHNVVDYNSGVHTSSVKLYLGCLAEDNITCTDHFNGYLDDLRFYSRGLSGREMIQLYQSETP